VVVNPDQPVVPRLVIITNLALLFDELEAAVLQQPD
jgi:hypothetical protein